MMIYTYLTIISIFLLNLVVLAERIDLLFVPHDAGESDFILPIIDALLHLAPASKYSDLNISVLVLGLPATDIF